MVMPRTPLVPILTFLSLLSSSATAWTQSCHHRGWVEKPIASRVDHGMAYDSLRGVTVLFGGWNGREADGETWEWDGNTWTLRATTGPSPRTEHAMAYDSARGVTVLFGGAD